MYLLIQMTLKLKSLKKISKSHFNTNTGANQTKPEQEITTQLNGIH